MKVTPIKNVINNYNQKIRVTIKDFFKNSINDDEVDDIQQHVYIKTWKNLSKLEKNSSITGWIKTITINTCKDFTKSKKPLYSSDDQLFQQVQDKKPFPCQKVLISERHQKIIRAIKCLPKKFEEVVMFHYIEELTVEEIALKLNCPTGTVKSRLFKARQLLKQELSDFLQN